MVALLASMAPMPKPSGQTEAWYRGYDWASDVGPHHELGIIEAAQAWGYDFDSQEDREFTKGAEFRQLEQAEDRSWDYDVPDARHDHRWVGE